MKSALFDFSWFPLAKSVACLSMWLGVFWLFFFFSFLFLACSWYQQYDYFIWCISFPVPLFHFHQVCLPFSPLLTLHTQTVDFLRNKYSGASSSNSLSSLQEQSSDPNYLKLIKLPLCSVTLRWCLGSLSCVFINLWC